MAPSGTPEAERRAAAGVLGGLAGLVLLWWVALATSPTVRSWFELDPRRRDVLSAFVLADLVVVAGGSAASAVLVLRDHPRAGVVVAGTAGGWAYATLVLVAWTVLGGDGAVGVVPMLVATVLVVGIAWRGSAGR
ncbi:hypothetical protein B7486_56770 [cyanobacterium TDX16]|nr:hypothetical protein B7486_56770 [cyanobacterium TDX16]